jgi:hypothetical protein
MSELAALWVADPPELWRQLGFAVDGGSARIGGIDHHLGAAGRGVTGWAWRGTEGLNELPTMELPAPAGPSPGPPHPNGVVALDHVVVATPDLQRTIDNFEHGGVELRRTREAGTPDRPTRQAFFLAGATIIEVVGAPDTAEEGPARFYGLAFTVTDLDATADFLGQRLRPPAEAVQQGRRIATLDRAAAGSGVPIVFMSPRT